MKRFLSLGTIACAIWYLLLALAHYLYQRPLWNDEECVLLNLRRFTTDEVFTREFLSAQTFPRVYFFLIQNFSRLFDFNLLSLRLFPFLSMVVAFFVWLKVASYELKDQWAYFTFVLSWSASAVLIYYAAELKQYSMDVLAAAAFLLFLYRQKSWEEGGPGLKYNLILLFLPFLIFFSYPACLFLIFPLLNLVHSGKGDRRFIGPLIFYLSSTMVVYVIAYYFDARLAANSAKDALRDYFVYTDSLPRFLQTLGEGTNNLFSRWFVERPKVFKQIGIFFVTFGFINLFYGFFTNIKKDKCRFYSINAVALIVFVELFILGVLKKYPFTIPRTSLFFCPVVLFLTVQAIFELKRYPYVHRPLLAAYVIFLMYVAVSLSGITLAGALSFRPVL